MDENCMSDEHKARISAALKTAWSDPNFRANTVAAQAKGQCDAWADPERRAKRMEKLHATLAAKKKQPISE